MSTPGSQNAVLPINTFLSSTNTSVRGINLCASTTDSEEETNNSPTQADLIENAISGHHLSSSPLQNIAFKTSETNTFSRRRLIKISSLCPGKPSTSASTANSTTPTRGSNSPRR